MKPGTAQLVEALIDAVLRDELDEAQTLQLRACLDRDGMRSKGKILLGINCRHAGGRARASIWPVRTFPMVCIIGLRVVVCVTGLVYKGANAVQGG